MNEPEVTVIVAVEHSQANLPAIFDRVMATENGPVEVILACLENDEDSTRHARQHGDVITVRVPAGSRIPHMWAAGIQAARGRLVAVTTAHCVPSGDWIDRIQALELPADVVGVGGVFHNPDTASGMDWAIFLLRYRQFSINNQAGEVPDIAADNAVYRKQDLLAQDDLLRRGFWEPEFHARFRKQGLRLLLNPSLVVEHRNRYTFRQFGAQRVEHGTAFGSARAAKLGLGHNLLLLLLSPALPLVFLGKIVSGTWKQREYRLRLVRCFPWLLAFVACWGFGECRGYFSELSARMAR